MPIVLRAEKPCVHYLRKKLNSTRSSYWTPDENRGGSDAINPGVREPPPLSVPTQAVYRHVQDQGLSRQVDMGRGAPVAKSYWPQMPMSIVPR